MGIPVRQQFLVMLCRGCGKSKGESLMIIWRGMVNAHSTVAAIHTFDTATSGNLRNNSEQDDKSHEEVEYAANAG